MNLKGVVNGVVAAYPLMDRQGHGHVVDTASTAGLAPAVMVALRAVLPGVARNRAVIVAPASARAVWYLQRLAPGVVERVGRRTAWRIDAMLEERK